MAPAVALLLRPNRSWTWARPVIVLRRSERGRPSSFAGNTASASASRPQFEAGGTIKPGIAPRAGLRRAVRTAERILKKAPGPVRCGRHPKRCSQGRLRRRRRAGGPFSEFDRTSGFQRPVPLPEESLAGLRRKTRTRYRFPREEKFHVLIRSGFVEEPRILIVARYWSTVGETSDNEYYVKLRGSGSV
jgi:hypothetical protein